MPRKVGGLGLSQVAALLSDITACTLNRCATVHLFLLRVTNGERDTSEDSDNNNYNTAICPTHVILYAIDMMDVPIYTKIRSILTICKEDFITKAR